VLHPQKIERVLALKNPIGEFAIRCNSTAVEAFFKQTGQKGISLPDPVCMGIALNPALCTSSSEHYIEIETASDLTRGTTVVECLGFESLNVTVVYRGCFREYLFFGHRGEQARLRDAHHPFLA